MVALLLIPPYSVYADIVLGNDFARENKEKKVPIDDEVPFLRFVVSSPAGYVIPKLEPGSEIGITPEIKSYYGFSHWEYSLTEENEVVFFNGAIILITHAYLHDGNYWGVMMPAHNYQPPGWVLMDEVLMIFEPEEFVNLFQHEFYKYTGDYDAVLSASRLVEWQWPGSDREKTIIFNITRRNVYAFETYRDEEGREWAMNSDRRWICLSDPENSDIPAFYPAPEPKRWSPDGNNEWRPVWAPTEPSANSANPFIIIAIAAALLLCVIIVVLVLRKQIRIRRQIIKETTSLFKR